MTTTATSRRSTLLTAVLVAVACGLAVVVATISTSQSARSAAPPRDVVTLHADHATFQGLNNLVGASEAVVTGTVLSTRSGTEIALPDDPTGSLPPIPQTDYTVRVDQSHKGVFRAGQTPVVVLIGGASGGQQYAQEGVPQLAEGQQYVFFLVAGDDGKFYPQAGGAAIATKNADGSFGLSEETTGGAAVSFVNGQLAKLPPPDHVTLTVLRLPLVQVHGDLQSGSVTVARTRGVPTSVTGTALVSGRVLAVDITIDRWRPSGRVVLDQTEYVLASGIAAAGKDGSVVVATTATSGGKTQAIYLQVFDR